MPKNIVVCCDGTDNRLTVNENSNVVHLYSCLQKDIDQSTYYNPGVGTIAPEWKENWISSKLAIFKDLIVAYSLEKNVKSAYIFLMNNYNPGDCIYLFGFSRGAYTVRMLCGMIQMFGLLYPGNHDHIDHIIKLYSKEGKKFRIASRMKRSFSQRVEIHFIGVWETVVSVGSVFKLNIDYPYSKSLSIAKTVRHAVSIDERRKHYRLSEVDKDHKDVLEVYFAGVHSDVGGSYGKEGLSKVALEWMIGEASQKGLKLNKAFVDHYIFGVNSNFQKPDFKSPIHNSMEGWKNYLPEIFPRRRAVFVKEEEPDGNGKEKMIKTWDLGFFPRRVIPDGANLHKSVIDKIGHISDNHVYAPENIDITSLKSYKIIENKSIIYS